MIRRILIPAIALFVCVRVIIAIGDYITEARAAMLNCGTQTNHLEAK